MKYGIFRLVLVVVCALMTACGGGKDALSGTNWTLNRINGEAPVDGTRPTLTFLDGAVNGSAGCNSFGGQYSADESAIAVDELFRTLMACPSDEDRVMAQEELYIAALTQAEHYQINDNQLILTTQDGGTLTFVRE